MSGSAQLDGKGIWSIGSNNKDFTFQGYVNGGGLVKIGNGMMTIGKKQDKLSKQVDVQGGTLNINSSATAITADNRWFGQQTVSVTNGGCFAGRGVVEKILVNNGGTLQPGNAANSIQYGALKTASGCYLYKGAKVLFNIYSAPMAHSRWLTVLQWPLRSTASMRPRPEIPSRFGTSTRSVPRPTA